MNIQQKPVKNYGNRNGQAIKGIILHIGEGNRNQIYSTFLNEEKSSHYLVNMDGSIWQFVNEKFSAWHAGKIDRPSSHLVASNPGVNPNEMTVGVENEGYSTLAPLEIQKNALAELVEDICYRNFIEITNLTVEPHHSIRYDKTCPGLISTPEIVKLAQRIRDNRLNLMQEQVGLLRKLINYLIKIKNGILKI